MLFCRKWGARGRIFLAGKFGHVDLPFCQNLLIALYKFITEKLLFVARSLKERLVINLESLLLHGNENLREPISGRGERGKGKIWHEKSIRFQSDWIWIVVQIQVGLVIIIMGNWCIKMSILEIISVRYVHLREKPLASVSVGVLFIILLKGHSFIYFFPVDHDDWNDAADQDPERAGGGHLGK